nr:hypothetical protein VW1E2_00056 [Enterobacter sp.]
MKINFLRKNEPQLVSLSFPCLDRQLHLKLSSLNKHYVKNELYINTVIECPSIPNVLRVVIVLVPPFYVAVQEI